MMNRTGAAAATMPGRLFRGQARVAGFCQLCW